MGRIEGAWSKWVVVIKGGATTVYGYRCYTIRLELFFENSINGVIYYGVNILYYVRMYYTITIDINDVILVSLYIVFVFVSRIHAKVYVLIGIACEVVLEWAGLAERVLHG